MIWLFEFINLLKKGWIESRFFQSVVICMLLIGLYSILPVKLFLVATPSIPTGVYKLSKFDDSRQRFSSHCFDNYRPDWLHSGVQVPNHQVSCKYLLGLPGDVISVENNTVTIKYISNSVEDFGVVKELEYERLTEFKGSPLGHVSIQGVIPRGHYYFGSDSKHGWDSKYVGLISDELIIGRATLLKQIDLGKL